MKKNNNNDKQLQNTFSTVIFLDYMTNFETSHHFLQPTYFKDELGITDMRDFQKKLLKNGLIKLKDTDTFCLTESGKKMLDENIDYVRLFNMAIPYISVFDYEIEKENMQDKSFEDILLVTLENKINQKKSDEEFNIVVKLHFEIAQISKSLEKNKRALYNYITVLYYQISGKEYYNYIEKCFSNELGVQQTRDMWKGLYIQNEVVRAVKELKDEFEECFIDEIYENNELKIHLFTKEKFKLFINSILEDEFEDSYWQGELHKAYYHIFDEISNRK
ncbi:hypothetical protein [Anaerofustis butyriciformans]|uniref:hypothetical protein n=1 Tax=Anaerofustis butyriciformans TaxID=3108533 RepID=UPI002E307BC5|nr:hypothetical protein [Anaerofustis sp. HA2171]